MHGGRVAGGLPSPSVSLGGAIATPPAALASGEKTLAQPRPSHLPSTRLPFERRVFTVVARVVFLREEADSDYHLILYEGGHHMIAEAPAPICDRHAKPVYRREMKQARRAAKSCAKAKVTGVAFFDFKHGQTGVAANAIELHPILHFKCLRS